MAKKPHTNQPTPVMEIDDGEPETEAPEVEAQAEEEPAPAPKKRQKAAPLFEDMDSFEPEVAPQAPPDISGILESLQKGAVKGIILPKAAAEAQDWSEKIGRALKAAMEAQPHGTPIKIIRIERAHGGSFYTIEIRGPRSAPASGTLQTSEFNHLCTHNPAELGRWLRRFGNVLLGRDRNA